MRRIIIIISLLIFCRKLHAGLPVDFFIRSEYKKDTIDYSDTERTYYGEKLTLLFSQESLFNFSYIYIDHTKESKYTWNLVLKDISPDLSIIAGNYFTNFGSGLLIGKKNSYDPDIFSIRVSEVISEKYKFPFYACNSGNPVFAFNGLALNCKILSKELRFDINIFYSIKERFIASNTYDSGNLSSSLETIDANTEKENNQNEPVQIHTGGIMLSCEILKNFLLQTYYLNAGIKSHYKNEISWDYDTGYNESSSTSGLNGFGLFAQYKDDFLCVLSEGAATQKEVQINGNKKENVKGYAILYRVVFSPPFLALAITGKDVQSTYYSPYSSSIGADYPEDALFIEAAIKPYANIKIAAGISSEKKTSPSSKETELPAVRKEKIAILYHYSFIEEFEIIFKRRERTDNTGEERRQVQTSATAAAAKKVKINLNSIYQYNYNLNHSSTYGLGLQLLPIENIKVNANYINARISRNNSVYVIASPIRDSSAPGFFIKQDSNTIVIRFDFRISGIYLSSRMLYQFYQKKSLYKQIEFFASGYF